MCCWGTADWCLLLDRGRIFGQQNARHKTIVYGHGNVGLSVKHWKTVSGIMTVSMPWNFKTSCMQAQTHHCEELVFKGKLLNLFVLNMFKTNKFSNFPLKTSSSQWCVWACMQLVLKFHGMDTVMIPDTVFQCFTDNPTFPCPYTIVLCLAFCCPKIRPLSSSRHQSAVPQQHIAFTLY